MQGSNSGIYTCGRVWVGVGCVAERHLLWRDIRFAEYLYRFASIEKPGFPSHFCRPGNLISISEPCEWPESDVRDKVGESLGNFLIRGIARTRNTRPVFWKPIEGLMTNLAICRPADMSSVWRHERDAELYRKSCV
jgi:hypothetical protein